MGHFFRYSLTFLLVLITLLECAQVIMRYVFQAPVVWLHETIIFPAIWMYMLGAANASRKNTQITAGILPALFSRRARCRAICEFGAQFFSLIISLWLTWHALVYCLYSLGAKRATGYLFLPMAIGEMAVGAGMILITIYTAINWRHSCRKLRNAFGKKPNS